MLLRIYLGENEKYGHEPLYEAVVMKAREMSLAGATVLRGPLGFGNSRHVHTTKILRLADDLPLIVEIVDIEEKLRVFLDAIADMVTSTLVTLEKVQVLQYGTNKNGIGG
jgi:hypothetical protein